MRLSAILLLVFVFVLAMMWEHSAPATRDVEPSTVTDDLGIWVPSQSTSHSPTLSSSFVPEHEPFDPWVDSSSANSKEGMASSDVVRHESSRKAPTLPNVSSRNDVIARKHNDGIILYAPATRRATTRKQHGLLYGLPKDEYPENAYPVVVYDVSAFAPRIYSGVAGDFTEYVSSEAQHRPSEPSVLMSMLEAFVSQSDDSAWDPELTLLAFEEQEGRVWIRQSEALVQEFEAYLDRLDQRDVRAIHVEFVPNVRDGMAPETLRVAVPWQATAVATSGLYETYIYDYDVEISTGGPKLGNMFVATAGRGTTLRATWTAPETLHICIKTLPEMPELKPLRIASSNKPIADNVTMPVHIDLETPEPKPMEWRATISLKRDAKQVVRVGDRDLGMLRVMIDRCESRRNWRRVSPYLQVRVGRAFRNSFNLELILRGTRSGFLGTCTESFLLGQNRTSQCFRKASPGGTSLSGLKDAEWLGAYSGADVSQPEAGRIAFDLCCFDRRAASARIEFLLSATQWTGTSRSAQVRYPGSTWREMETVDFPTNYVCAASRVFEIRDGETRELTFDANLGLGPEELRLTVRRIPEIK